MKFAQFLTHLLEQDIADRAAASDKGPEIAHHKNMKYAMDVADQLGIAADVAAKIEPSAGYSDAFQAWLDRSIKK